MKINVNMHVRVILTSGGARILNNVGEMFQRGLGKEDCDGLRVSRVRVRKGKIEGRVISGSPKVWEEIPAGSSVELM